MRCLLVVLAGAVVARWVPSVVGAARAIARAAERQHLEVYADIVAIELRRQAAYQRGYDDATYVLTGKGSL